MAEEGDCRLGTLWLEVYHEGEWRHAIPDYVAGTVRLPAETVSREVETPHTAH